MIIVSFNQIADVPPQNVNQDILRTVLYDAMILMEKVDRDSLNQSLIDWEMDLLLSSNEPNDNWYTKALFVMCLRGLRGESRPNILNINE